MVAESTLSEQSDRINLPARLRSVEEAGNVPRWLEDMALEAADEIERLRAVETMAKAVLEELDGQEILVSTGIKASFLAEALGVTT